MPTKSAMDKVNALISNEVSARATASHITVPKVEPIPDYWFDNFPKDLSYGEEAELDLGITDSEAQAYFFPPSAGGKAKATVKKFNVISSKQMKEKKSAPRKPRAKETKPRPKMPTSQFKKSLTKAQQRAAENREIRNMGGAGKFLYRENKITKGAKRGTFEKFYFNPKTMVRHPAELGEPKSADFGYEVGTSKYM